MNQSRLPIIIIGGGIAGLAIAQGLSKHKVFVRIYEAKPRPDVGQGHRFRLSCETLEALKRLLPAELQELLRITQAYPTRYEPRHVDAKALDFPQAVIVDEPKSMPVDRAWLRLLLSLGLEDVISYEKRFHNAELVDKHMRVHFTDGTSADGRFVIGADGIKSAVRRQLQPERRLLDVERNIMWGRTILTPAIKNSLPADLLSWLMIHDKDANRQLVVDPMLWSGSVHEVSKGCLPDTKDYVYWALGTESVDRKLQTAEEKKDYLKSMVEDWHRTLKLLLSSADHDSSACVRILSSKPDIGTWPKYAGNITLIGDAAHAMSPMGGAGADTAIRDAACLVDVIHKGLMPEGVAAFEGDMRERAAQKIEHSFQNGVRFWDGRKWEEYHEASL